MNIKNLGYNPEFLEDYILWSGTTRQSKLWTRAKVGTQWYSGQLHLDWNSAINSSFQRVCVCVFFALLWEYGMNHLKGVSSSKTQSQWFLWTLHQAYPMMGQGQTCQGERTSKCPVLKKYRPVHKDTGSVFVQCPDPRGRLHSGKQLANSVMPVDCQLEEHFGFPYNTYHCIPIYHCIS